MSQERMGTIIRDLMAGFDEVMKRHNITHEEYRAGVAFLAEAAQAGETVLLHDALLEAAVVRHGTDGVQAQVLGPYYLPDAPLLEDVAIIDPRFEKTLREAKENNLGYADVQNDIDEIREINAQIVRTMAVLNNTPAGLG